MHVSVLIGIQILCLWGAVFIGLHCWSLYRLYYPATCYSYTNQCVKNYVAKTPLPLLKLWVYSSTSPSPNGTDLYGVWELNDFKANENVTKDVTVRIPLGMRNNGTMFVHVFLTPAEGGRGEENPFDADWMVNQTGELTTCTIDQSTALQVTNNSNPVEKKLEAADRMTCHWRSRLTLSVMTDDVAFHRTAIPVEITDYIRLRDDQYLPVLVIDEVSSRTPDLMPLNNTCKEMPLTINYTPVSHGRFRIWMNIKTIINQENNGVSEWEKQYLKDVFVNRLPSRVLFENLQRLCLLFELLAIESDIRFWQKRTTMGGLSTQTVIWRCVCFVVLFLHSVNVQTCLASIIVIGFITIFEIWKVFKVFQARVRWSEWRLVVDNDVGGGSKERETQALDSQAMRYLSWVLYPSWVAVIIYSLVYNFQKSWYSLCILSLINGFCCFGSIFMLPQVFINYKLKSVADLPWMALMFRAASTVTKDICQFLLLMPFDFSGACFLDDIIFVIYLYQRWLYEA